MRIQMRLVKIIWLVGLIGASLPSLVAAEDLKVAITSTSKPFSTMDSTGILVGFNVEVVKEICARLNRSCVLQPTRFPKVLSAVSSGEADLGVANMLKTPEREKQVAFTMAYWRSTSSFVGVRGTRLDYRKVGLDGHTVCAIKGTRQLAFIGDLAKVGEGTVMVAGGNEDLIGLLATGECQLAILPTLQGLPFLQSEKGKNFDFVGTPLSEQGLGGDVHMVVRLDRPELLDQVNQILEGIIKDGTHEKLTRKFFPFSIL